VASPPVQSKVLISERLLSESLVLAFPRGHRFKKYDGVPWKALVDQPYVLFAQRRAPAYDEGYRVSGALTGDEGLERVMATLLDQIQFAILRGSRAYFEVTNSMNQPTIKMLFISGLSRIHVEGAIGTVSAIRPA